MVTKSELETLLQETVNTLNDLPAKQSGGFHSFSSEVLLANEGENNEHYVCRINYKNKTNEEMSTTEYFSNIGDYYLYSSYSMHTSMDALKSYFHTFFNISSSTF